MNTRSLISRLGKKFPKKSAAEYDYPGLQVAKFHYETNNILLALDFDRFVFEYMENENLLDKIDLVITHHPFIYGKRRDVLSNDEEKNKLFLKMEELNIPVFSLHTNFDTCKDGMNDALTEALCLEDIKPLENYPMARGGRLPKPMKAEDFSKYAIEKLDLDYAHLINSGKEIIETVAIVGGGGSRARKVAKEEGYDIFISGDIPHYARRDICIYNYNFLDVPHEVEQIFMKQFKKILLSIDSSLNVICVYQEKLPKLICK